MLDTDLMPFGEHKGKALANVPSDYLLWYYTTPWADKWKDLFAYVTNNIDVLRQDVKANKVTKYK